jgi:hypothetical protein
MRGDGRTLRSSSFDRLRMSGILSKLTMLLCKSPFIPPYEGRTTHYAGLIERGGFQSPSIRKDKLRWNDIYRTSVLLPLIDTLPLRYQYISIFTGYSVQETTNSINPVIHDVFLATIVILSPPCSYGVPVMSFQTCTISKPEFISTGRMASSV